MDNTLKYAIKGYMEEVRRTSAAYHVPSVVLDAFAQYANVKLCIEEGITPAQAAEALRNSNEVGTLVTFVDFSLWGSMHKPNSEWREEFYPADANVSRMRAHLWGKNVRCITPFVTKNVTGEPEWFLLRSFDNLFPDGPDVTIKTDTDAPFFEIEVQDYQDRHEGKIFHYDLAQLQYDGKLEARTDQVFRVRMYLGPDTQLTLLGGYRSNNASITIYDQDDVEIGVMPTNGVWEQSLFRDGPGGWSKNKEAQS